MPRRSEAVGQREQHRDSHGHSHGLVNDSIKHSREGLRAVSLALVERVQSDLQKTAGEQSSRAQGFVSSLV